MAVTLFDLPYLKTHAACKITALCLIEPELLPIKVLHCGNRNFQPSWLLWPWPDVCVDMPRVQIWTFYIKAFESYRLTDIHTNIQTWPKLVNARSGRKWTGSGPVTSPVWTGPIRTKSVTLYSPSLDLYFLGYRGQKCGLHALTIRRHKIFIRCQPLVSCLAYVKCGFAK